MCECCDYIAANRGRASEERLVQEYERLWRARVRKRLATYGWTVQTVDGWPPFAYTIGLWRLGHPELVLFGLEPQKAYGLLGVIAEDVCINGRRVADGDEFFEGDWEFKAFALPKPGQVVARANVFFRRKPRQSVPALQLVYPDVHGVWPWEPDCHLFPGQQPMPGQFAA
jgi:Domain of unknown function (DUF4262)